MAAKIKNAKAKKKSQQGKKNTSLNFNEVKPNSNDVILRRLARDGHDELLDAIERGELSVNQAAIQAGYRKKLSPCSARR